MLKWYARSLDACDYDIVEHPSCHDFICGMMTDIAGFPEFEELRDRFPPRALPGLDPKISYWRPLTVPGADGCEASTSGARLNNKIVQQLTG
jgi:hypothetical protein